MENCEIVTKEIKLEQDLESLLHLLLSNIR